MCYRLGEEKESARGQLDIERQEFEAQLQSVLEQQERILGERESEYINAQGCDKFQMGKWKKLSSK